MSSLKEKILEKITEIEQENETKIKCSTDFHAISVSTIREVKHAVKKICDDFPDKTTQKDDWIPCETPPEKSGRYLVHTCSEHFGDDVAIATFQIIGKNWYITEDRVKKITDIVVEWQPLPKVGEKKCTG